MESAYQVQEEHERPPRLFETVDLSDRDLERHRSHSERERPILERQRPISDIRTFVTSTSRVPPSENFCVFYIS